MEETKKQEIKNLIMIGVNKDDKIVIAMNEDVINYKWIVVSVLCDVIKSVVNMKNRIIH